jgi:K(+)-stimulated pyrophosphate-energized sodium pump
VLAVLAALDWITWGVFGAAVSGSSGGVIIGPSTEYYTSDANKPTQGIAKNKLSWARLQLYIEEWRLECLQTWIPVLTIVAGIIACYGFAGGFSNFAMGVYGIGLLRWVCSQHLGSLLPLMHSADC